MDSAWAQLLAEIKEKVDIVEIVSRYLSLKRVGKNYKALCPFHQEKTPSFTVSPEKQFFYCFGCGASGDVFHFLMRMEGLSFPEAVSRLAEETGIRLSQFKKQRKGAEKERFYMLYSKAASLFRRFLKEDIGQKARELALSRGLTPQIWDRFLLGFAPDGGNIVKELLKKEGFSEEEMLTAGLLSQGETKETYSRFRGRLMIPIWDHRGRVVAFGGRAIFPDQEPKYLNSPEHLLFKKGEILYPYHIAKEAIQRDGFVLVVEGYMDAISCHVYGWENTVASLGTALTSSQAKKLSALTKDIYLCYDADEAGEKACIRAAQAFFAYGVVPKVVVLPESKDPDAVLREDGREAFDFLVKNAPDVILWRMEKLKEKYSLDVPPERAQWVKETLAFIEPLKDEVLKETYLIEISRYSGVSVETLKKTFYRKRISKIRTISSLQGSWEVKLIALSTLYPPLWDKRREWEGLFKDKAALKLWERMVNSSNPSAFLASLEEDERSFLGKNLVELPQEDEVLINECMERLKKRRLEMEAQKIKEKIAFAPKEEKKILCEKYFEILRYIKGEERVYEVNRNL